MAKGGKYKNVAKTLPKYQEDPAEQNRIDPVKAEILKTTPRDISALSVKYAEARRQKKELEAELSAANTVVDALTQLLVEQYDDDDATGIRLKDGSSIFIHSEPYASVKDKDAFRKWCIKEGLERSLQLPWPKTNELTKLRLLDGKSEPPGVKAWNKPKVSFRDPTGKDE